MSVTTRFTEVVPGELLASVGAGSDAGNVRIEFYDEFYDAPGQKPRLELRVWPVTHDWSDDPPVRSDARRTGQHLLLMRALEKRGVFATRS